MPLGDQVRSVNLSAAEARHQVTEFQRAELDNQPWSHPVLCCPDLQNGKALCFSVSCSRKFYGITAGGHGARPQFGRWRRNSALAKPAWQLPLEGAKSARRLPTSDARHVL